MTNTTGPARLRQIAEFTILSAAELRQLAAAWDADLSARDHAVDLAGINAEAANELERRAERAEAALEQANSKIAYYEGDGSVRAYEALVGTDAPRHKFTDEGICIRCGEDAEEWDVGCVEELAAEIEKKAAALERARALVRQLRIASDDPRASYETSRAYERAANDLDAALWVAPVSAQTCQECGHLESEHRSVAGGLGFACRHAGCDCIKQAAAPGGAA